MSLSQEYQLSVDNRVSEENFLYSEYIKRYFEEYADENDRRWVIENWKFPIISQNMELCEIQNYVRQFLIQYDDKLNKCTTNDFYELKSIFDNKKLKSWAVTAHNISLKYGLSISDILFPFDMLDVLNKIVDDNFSFKETIFFDKQASEKIRGFSTFYDQEKRVLVFTVDIGSEVLDIDKLLTDISVPMIVLRDSFGYSISQSEKDLLVKFSKTDISKNYRSSPNLLYSRAIGLFSWDKIKLNSWTIDDVMIYLHENNLILKKNKKRLKYNICKNECRNCNEKESCRRFFADCFRFAALSIKNKKIVPTSASGSVNNLSFSKNKFDRVLYR